MLTKLLMVVCAILALAHRSWWWWGVAFFFILDRLDNWQYYYSRPWRKLHFPLMRLYATCAGIEDGFAEIGGRNYDLKRATSIFLKRVHPDWEDHTINDFIE